MKPILKEAKWGYNDMTETYVVELHILDENTGKDHYINLSEFYRYQRLYITVSEALHHDGKYLRPDDGRDHG